MTIFKKNQTAKLLPKVSKSLAVGLLVAASVSARPAAPYPKAIQGVVDKGVKVVKSFPAASGLTGWILSQGGCYSIVFITSDKKTLLAGALIDENGENLSAQYEEK